MWRVIIVERKTGKVVETIPCGSLYEAEKVERGICINLNHEGYNTDIEEVEE